MSRTLLTSRGFFYREACGPRLGPSAIHALGLRWGAGAQWAPSSAFSAAASVGDGRSPLGCITRAGRRDARFARAHQESAARPRSCRDLPGLASGKKLPCRLPVRTGAICSGGAPAVLCFFPVRKKGKGAFRQKGAFFASFPGAWQGRAHFHERNRERNLGRRNRWGGFFREFPCGAWRSQSRLDRIGKYRPGGEFI